MKQFLQLTTICLVALIVLFNAPDLSADSPRKVLVEEGTNASCGPCASQNPSFKQWLGDNSQNVIPLIYHAWWPGANDPMFKHNEPMNRGRVGDYYGMNNEGVPVCRMNGTHPKPTSSGWYAGAPGDLAALNSELSKYNGAISPITLTITQTKSGNNFNVGVNVATTQAIQGKKLRVAVVEYHLYYAPGVAGNNGETDFYYVARKMLPDHNGTTINQNAGSNQDYTFNVPIHADWKTEGIYIVAFIQDDNTKEVLQAGDNLKKVSLTATISQPFLKVDPNSSVEGEVTITNPNSVAMNVSFAIDNDASSLPTGWNGSVKPTNAYLQPGASTTVKVTINCPDAAGFVMAMLKASPLGVDGILEDARAEVYALSTKTKLVLWGNISTQWQGTYYALAGTPSISSLMAVLPIADEILAAYPPESTFELAVFPINSDNRGVIGASLGNGIVLDLINSMINAGKGILITSELDLAVSNGPNGTGSGKKFYSDLGIAANTNPAYVSRANIVGNQIQLIQFPAAGVAGDPIGEGFQTTMNQYSSTTWPFYVMATDILKAVSADVKPFMYYDNNPNYIGGVRLQKGDARIVYMSVGFEAIANQMARNGLMDKVIYWLMNPSSNKGPEILASVSSINFGEVPVETFSEKTFDITNTGDEILVVESIDFGFGDDAFSFVNLPKFPMNIEPEGKVTIKIKFAPSLTGDYTEVVDIKSNARTSPEIAIFIDAKAVPGTDVQDPVNVSSGAFSMNVGPNPFAGRTNVNFKVRNNEQQVEISILDASGKIVTKISDEIRQVGDHSVMFDASGLASGTYFVRARVNGETIQVPVALMR